jgi:hypothetical protein
MSGAPLWLLYDKRGHNDTSVTPVVGVFIEFRKSSQTLVSTDVSTALDMIARH